MPILAPLVAETTTTTGTGDVTLTGRTAEGWRTFNGAYGAGATLNVFYYWIRHRTALEWEFGSGHLSAATTLVRDTVILSSNANAAVSFAAGTKDVYCDAEGVSHWVRPLVGEYYSSAYTANTTQSFGNVQFRAVPFLVGVTRTYDRIGIEVTTGLGSAGTVYLGIYTDGPSGPASLIVDAGIVDPNTTGLKELTISQLLQPGMYWLVAKNDTGTFTSRAINGQSLLLAVQATTNGNNGLMIASGVATGALPATAPATTVSSQSGPKIMLRAT